MEIQRKYKIFSIIALTVAVVSLSVGFAAFERMLNISSEATISLPSEDEFNIEIYGINSIEQKNLLNLNKVDFSTLSKEKSLAFDFKLNSFLNSYATIDNENLTIDINNLVLEYSNMIIYYSFIIKNNSNYGVYLSFSDESMTSFDNGWIPQSCVASEETSQEIVNNVCSSINLLVGPYDSSDAAKFLNGDFYIPANEYQAINALINYKDSDYKVDGDFSVIFSPVKLDFDVVPHMYNNITVTNEDA